jgi:hypothetical protein
MTETAPEPATVAPDPGTAGTVPCVYCREPIAADAFTYRSGVGRLLSAACPTCQRRVTLSDATWQRWSRERSATAGTP